MGKFFLGITAVIILSCGAFFTMGGMANTSTTVSPGLYWKVDKPLAIGKIVVFCPPNRPEFQEAKTNGKIQTGSCPDGFAPIMLKVAAKYKNKVTINESGVYINDTLYPQSKPLLKDQEGRPMPFPNLVNYELKEKDILLMSDASGEIFDGRYFGLIDADQIDSVITRIFP